MKTQCNTAILNFSSLSSKKLQADFDGGTITSDAGMLLLREVDHRIGLTQALAACVPDPRNQIFVVHPQTTMMAQRIFALAAGYEDLNDHQTLRDDSCFKILAERKPDGELPLASPPTLWRMENRADKKALADMMGVFVETFIASYTSPPKWIVLDFDATDIPLHGNQERRFFHGYYDEYCFLPLYVFCGDQLLIPYLRPSRNDAAKNSRALLKLLTQRLREAWPEVKILVRGDSGFCRWKFMKWCDENGVYYLLGLAQNKILLENALPWTIPAEWHFNRTQEKIRFFGSFRYAAATWDRERRVIIKAEHSTQGDNPRFLVTNLPGDAHTLYDEIYCARGEMENRLKEQFDLFAAHTSSHYYLNNQSRLLEASAAYILVETLRRLGLPGTSLEQAQVGTIRTKLLKVGAIVNVSVRRIIFRLAGGYPLQSLFRKIVQRLTASPSAAVSSG